MLTVDDYGAATEIAIHAKRADYFEAGTLVVWDVDLSDRVIWMRRMAFIHPEGVI